jgi:hypothetical protein
MPELINPNEYRGYKRKIGPRFLTKNINRIAQMEEELSAVNKGVVDSGAKSVVVVKKRSPEKLVAINYKPITPEEAKKVFYVQRIFSTLFPHNFPHFYGAFGDNPKDPLEKLQSVTGTVRQRVRRVKLNNQKARYPFKEVLEGIKEIGLSSDIFDSASSNYIVGQDGGEYYVDTINQHLLKPDGFDINKIIEFMKAHGHSKRNQYIVVNSFKRLRTLAEQKEGTIQDISVRELSSPVGKISRR